MPQLPVPYSQENVRVGGIDTRASPRAFGYDTGSALKEMGGALGSFSGELAERARRDKVEQDNLREANAEAQLQPELTRIALTEKANAPADGSGVAEETIRKQTEHYEKYADDVFSNPGDDKLRMRFKANGAQRVAQYGSDAVKFEFDQRSKNNLDQTNKSIDGLVNNVRADINQYDQSVLDGEKVIDAALNIPAPEKLQMKTALRSDLAMARFDAGITAANSSDDFDALAKELGKDKWKQDMDPAAYARAQDSIRIAHNQFVTGERTETRALLSSGEERSAKLQIIPPGEMKEIDARVRRSRDPDITNRYMKLVDQQNLLRNAGKAPPLQLRKMGRQVRSGAELQGEVNGWACAA